jgi:replication initiation and membrane attachment protein DnaB
MATTSKEINLSQLDKELGSQGLCADFNDPKKKIIIPAENSNVTEDELKAAIANHVAQPDEVQIRQLNREQGLVKLKELGFTDDQIAALIG